MRKYLFGLMASEVSVLHGGEDMAEQSNSHHGSQKIERGKALEPGIVFRGTPRCPTSSS
jgi:hypothetical protein